MASQTQLKEAYALLLSDCTDETIELSTGVGLLDILALRAAEAGRVVEASFSTPMPWNIAVPG